MTREQERMVLIAIQAITLGEHFTQPLFTEEQVKSLQWMLGVVGRAGDVYIFSEIQKEICGGDTHDIDISKAISTYLLTEGEVTDEV